MAERIFLIDATAFAYRAFFAIRNLTDSKGRPTNAVFGFARVMLKLLREHRPEFVVAVFDAPGKNFRHEVYPDYKATREKTPQELVDQLPHIDQLVDALNIRQLRVDGVEADDVIGTLADTAHRKGLDAVVISGDKDLLQLVRDGVTVYDPAKGDDGKWYAHNDVVERYGVSPDHIIDLFALMGDASDNVPGVRGIGEKTARKLLEQYGDLNGVYEHLDDLKGKQREKLEEDKDLAFLSRDLVTIRHDVDVAVDLDECRLRAYDADKLVDLFHQLEFQGLLEEFLPDERENGETPDYRLVLTEDELDEVIAQMQAAGTFAVDTETTSVDAMQAELVGVSLCCTPGKAWYIPVGHAPEALQFRENDEDLFPSRVLEPLARKTVLDRLRPLLEDPGLGKVGHNIKYDLVVLRRAGVELRGIVMDTMVASYLTNPSRLRHNLAEVSLQYLKRKMIPISDLIGKGAKAVTFDTVPIDRACEYACEDADVTWRLKEVFEPLLRERQLESLFTDIELPLIGVLADMEMRGIAIDTAVFDELRREISQRLEALETQIFEEAGGPFLISSPKQLQEVLFERLGLSTKRKTKTGYSTDVDVLEQLRHEHALPGMILDFRSLDKLRGTYVEALPRLVHPETGRLHTSFNQTVAATGRLSSSDPNLQNIPVRTELGKRIRRGFVAGRADWKLISADYSQIELRILAHLSGDDALQSAFREDKDVHRDTAARVFGVEPADVTPEMRRHAKAVNFGIVYGISPYGLSRSIDVSVENAATFIDQYFEQYPGVRTWIDHILEQARQRGYVTTLLQRRRYVPELTSSNAAVRRAAERAAMNTPVQGTAADVIKAAMVRLAPALQELGEAAQVLQVHDELIVECPAGQVDEVTRLMRNIMEQTIALDVPLKVDVGVGDNWEEIH